MVRIIGAIASSHTSTIGFALDGGKQCNSAWQPIFDAYAPIRGWVAEKTGASNDVYAGTTRRQTVEEFQRIRNAQVVYSVGGREPLDRVENGFDAKADC